MNEKKEGEHSHDDVKMVTIITENLCKAGEEFSGRKGRKS